MPRGLIAAIAAVLLAGCATGGGPELGVEPGVHEIRVQYLVLHEDRESLRAATPAGYWSPGMFGFATSTAIHCLAPDGWLDLEALCGCGHELMHAVGAWHDGRMGCP